METFIFVSVEGGMWVFSQFPSGFIPRRSVPLLWLNGSTVQGLFRDTKKDMENARPITNNSSCS